MEFESGFRTVVVAGSSSGVGKTSVAETITQILSPLGRIGAAKITVTHGDRGCPHGGKGCNVCSSLGGDFQVIIKDSIILQSGTDTSRLHAAGGRPVIWGITRDIAIKPAWDSMSAVLMGIDCAVIESNSLAQHITPSLTLMVVDASVSRKLWKPSAEYLIGSADYIIFNNRGSQKQREMLSSEVQTLRNNMNDVIRVDHPHELRTHENLIQSLRSIIKPAIYRRGPGPPS
jgi:hypothetical protein